MFDRHLSYGCLHWVLNKYLLSLTVSTLTWFTGLHEGNSPLSSLGQPHGVARSAARDAPGDFRGTSRNYKMKTLFLSQCISSLLKH